VGSLGLGATRKRLGFQAWTLAVTILDEGTATMLTAVLSGIHALASRTLSAQAIPQFAFDRFLHFANVCVAVAVGIIVVVVCAAFVLVFRLSRSQQRAHQQQDGVDDLASHYCKRRVHKPRKGVRAA
jgi:hypothetical protein